MVVYKDVRTPLSHAGFSLATPVPIETIKAESADGRWQSQAHRLHEGVVAVIGPISGTIQPSLPIVGEVTLAPYPAHVIAGGPDESELDHSRRRRRLTMSGTGVTKASVHLAV